MQRLLTLALAAAISALAAGPALAAKGQLSIFQHDSLLRGSDDAERARTLDELDRLGVDVVKAILLWRDIAPGGESKPDGFDGANPASYPPGAWNGYDALVRQAQARGMRVLFALGGRAPDWASSGTDRAPGTRKPGLNAFRDFAEAAGIRYSGSYGAAPDPALPLPTEGEAPAPLPRVTLWSVWNEPNLGSWLAPQRRSGIPYAPHHYRRMVNGARSGLSASGHGGDTLLIGELLPYGSSSNRIRPLEFLREMACVDRKYRPFRGRAARRRGCGGFEPLPGSGLAFHPYNLAGGPNVRMSHPDDVTISYLPRLTKALDRLGARKRLQRRRMPVWVTEYAFQTDPPDIFQTPIRRVPGYMGLSEWLTYRNPRVRSHSQYLLFDDRMTGSGFGRYSGFQSGIRYANGKAKPGVYSAYRLPFFVRLRGRSRVEAWGGIRASGSGRTVTVQVRRGGKWRRLGTARTGERGYFRRTLRISSARKRTYRFRGGGHTSVQLRAVRR